ncbi:unnamed protein product [Oppiella nova]|uniref:Uncharacterized protein n=1 Tax=Oppiella nova TaxID=334625 RepID=A0A7R9QI98_9ACAR|nr:unnamed protein product [Oppiella nova]CAG2166267.1 unnamed protein product [Oppiella nova]
MSAKKRSLDSASDPSDLSHSSDTTSDDKSGKRHRDDDHNEPDDCHIDDDVKRFEEKYDNRYTEEDQEYKDCMDRPALRPPILWGYFGKNRNRDRFRSLADMAEEEVVEEEVATRTATHMITTVDPITTKDLIIDIRHRILKWLWKCQRMSEWSHLLARVNYPMYCVRTLSERHILVAGGGGPAKTGIANTLEVYELVYDKSTNSCKARLITHYDTGSRAVMNMCVVDKSNYCYQLFCGGMDGMCTQYDLKLNVESKRRESSSSPTRRERTFSETSLRRRRLSSRSESIEKENDINLANSQSPEAPEPVKQHSRKDSKPKMTDDTNGVPDFTFDIKQQKMFKTDFNSDESFQKIVKFSVEANVLITAGSDGHIRLWSLPKLDQILSIKAHDNEVDDLDINGNGTQIVSVSRDSKGFVWNTNDGSLKTELKYELPVAQKQQNHNQNNNNNRNGIINNKYIYRGCRYTTVDGMATT